MYLVYSYYFAVMLLVIHLIYIQIINILKLNYNHVKINDLILFCSFALLLITLFASISYLIRPLLT